MKLPQNHLQYSGQALINLTRVGVQFKIKGKTYAHIIWLDEIDAIPSEADFLAERQRLIDEYDAKEYQRKRKAEYPTIEELVVALYDTEDKAAIDAKRSEIKLKYPKPGA
jgi:hypothetical protein